VMYAEGMRAMNPERLPLGALNEDHLR